MAILNFNDYLKEDSSSKRLRKTAAGVALIYDNKILLVHPTDSSWIKATCGIPKGGMEESEETMESALRELREETGIVIEPNKLDPSPESVEMFNSEGQAVRQLIYYVCKIDSLAEVGLVSERIPKDQLQLEEVDWAKFVGPEEAYKLMSRSQLIILDRHLTR